MKLNLVEDKLDKETIEKVLFVSYRNRNEGRREDNKEEESFWQKVVDYLEEILYGEELFKYDDEESFKHGIEELRKKWLIDL